MSISHHRRAGGWLAASMFALGGLSATAAFAADSVIPDAQLAVCVNKSINPSRAPDTPITAAEIAALTALSCSTSASSGPYVQTLDGLNLATSLVEADLYGQKQIASLTPLAGAVKLQTLTIAYGASSVSDISPLSALPLVTLELNGSPISDLSPLKNMLTLQSLTINNAAVKDISALAGLVNLKALYLNINEIEDPAPLKGLSKLVTLVLSSNNLKSLAPLSESDFPSLSRANFSGNQILDMSSWGVPKNAYLTDPPGFGLNAQEQQTSSGTAFVPAMATEYHRNLGKVVDLDGSEATLSGENAAEVASYPAVDGVITWPADQVQTNSNGESFFYAFFQGKPSVGSANMGEYGLSGWIGMPVVRTDFAGYANNGDLGTVVAGKPFSHTFALDSAFPVKQWALGDAAAKRASSKSAKAAPADLTIDNAGTLSGTPATPGPYNFVVSATDEAGNQVVRPFSLVVAAAPVDPDPKPDPGPDPKPDPGPDPKPDPGPDPKPPVGGAQAVPTLDTAGLMLLAALMAGGYATVKRRKKN